MEDRIVAGVVLLILSTAISVLMWERKRVIQKREEEKKATENTLKNLQAQKEEEREERLLMLISKADEKSNAFMEAANKNTSALIQEVKQLTKVVNNQTVQSDAIIRSLKITDEKLEKHERVYEKLFDKTDALELQARSLEEKTAFNEKNIDKIQEKCNTQH